VLPHLFEGREWEEDEEEKEKARRRRKRRRSHDFWSDPCVFIHRVIQEERSIFWEVIVSVIVRKECSYEHV
jgi:hypothetical protein